MTIIELNQVSKISKGKRLLKQISLTVDKGIIYGMIGSDHSRKSLLLKLMLGLVKSTEGEVRFFNKPYETDMLNRIGVAIDDVSFYKHLTARENIMYYLEAFKSKLSDDLTLTERLEMYFRQFDLLSDIDTIVKKYSLGMLQKLRLIRALIIDPEILILDEPAKSLDPVAIKILKEELLKRANAGVTIFIATSMLSFISDLADHIGVLHYGELIDEISADERQKDQQDYLEIHSDELPRLILIIERELEMYDYEVIDDHIIRILEQLDNEKIISKLVENDINILQVRNGFVSLEDFFLSKIGE
jgi:ABC-type multidrug transport system ATPase subunit